MPFVPVASLTGLVGEGSVSESDSKEIAPAWQHHFCSGGQGGQGGMHSHDCLPSGFGGGRDRGRGQASGLDVRSTQVSPMRY